jgi:hypothetical protein
VPLRPPVPLLLDKLNRDTDGSFDNATVKAPSAEREPPTTGKLNIHVEDMTEGCVEGALRDRVKSLSDAIQLCALQGRVPPTPGIPWRLGLKLGEGA